MLPALLDRALQQFSSLYAQATEFITENPSMVYPAAIAAGLFILMSASAYLIVLTRKRARKNAAAREEAPAAVKEECAGVMEAPVVENAARQGDATVLQARFTSLEGLEGGVDEAAEILDEFFAAAREVVEKTGGAFEQLGDATTAAHWGIARTTGSPAHDALNAIRAALLLRTAAHEMNTRRAACGEPALPIVTGVSSGQLVCARISAGRLCLFGEPAILAVKARETAERNAVDIVMTAKTWRLVKEYVIAQELSPLPHRKGAAPVRLFGLVNLRAAPGTAQPFPLTLAQLRKSFV